MKIDSGIGLHWKAKLSSRRCANRLSASVETFCTISIFMFCCFPIDRLFFKTISWERHLKGCVSALASVNTNGLWESFEPSIQSSVWNYIATLCWFSRRLGVFWRFICRYSVLLASHHFRMASIVHQCLNMITLQCLHGVAFACRRWLGKQCGNTRITSVWKEEVRSAILRCYQLTRGCQRRGMIDVDGRLYMRVAGESRDFLSVRDPVGNRDKPLSDKLM